MMELADERRVRITRFARQGGSADIEVQWTGDRTTNGTDYIEALYRAGIISNFDVIGDPPINIQYTTDGTRVFSATYRVALR
jgi:hypothetical protein